MDNFSVVHNLFAAPSAGSALVQGAGMALPTLHSRFEFALAVLAGWPRRLAALVCLIAAVGSVLLGRHPARLESLSNIVVSTRLLKPGIVLSSADLQAVRWPVGAVPAAGIRRVADVIGRRVAAPMSRGEPFTLQRLMDSAIADALSIGQVATTIRLADPGQAAILQAGALIDLYAGADAAVLADGHQVSPAAPAAPVASGVEVLVVLAEPADSGSAPGPTVVIAASRNAAAQLAAHAAGPFLATLIRPP